MANKSMIFGHIDALGVAQRALVNADNRQEHYALSSKAVALNVTASAVIKATPGRACRVIVLTAGSAPGALHDSATIGGVSAATLLFNIPNTVGVYDLDLPASAGVTYILGTGQVVNVSYI